MCELLRQDLVNLGVLGCVFTRGLPYDVCISTFWEFSLSQLIFDVHLLKRNLERIVETIFGRVFGLWHYGITVAHVYLCCFHLCVFC